MANIRVINLLMMDEKSGAALNSRFVPECGA